MTMILILVLALPFAIAFLQRPKWGFCDVTITYGLWVGLYTKEDDSTKLVCLPFSKILYKKR